MDLSRSSSSAYSSSTWTPFTPGEQIESASPIDPSFWPIHPTMDRLLQYKRMAMDFTWTTWGTSTARTDDDVQRMIEGLSLRSKVLVLPESWLRSHR